MLAVTATITVLCGALVYVLEGPNPASPINTLLDGLYWAVGTITRTGYGDVVPVTNAGRLVSMVLALSGFAAGTTCMAWILARLTMRHES